MGFFFFEIDDYASCDRAEEKVKSEEEGVIGREPFTHHTDSSRPGKRYPYVVKRKECYTATCEVQHNP